MSESPVPPHRRPEALLAHAQEQVAKIDHDRELARLVREGWDDQRIIAHLGAEQRRIAYVRRILGEGREVRPLTPYELGMRRAVGQISTEEMMARLKSWPYTFGVLHYDAWEAGSWDDVVSLRMTGFLTPEEHAGLQALVRPQDHVRDA